MPLHAPTPTHPAQPAAQEGTRPLLCVLPLTGLARYQTVPAEEERGWTLGPIDPKLLHFFLLEPELKPSHCMIHWKLLSWVVKGK